MKRKVTNDISNIEKIILIIVRVLFAATFIFSGFVKAVDPLGLTYKMQEYLIAFGPFFANFSNFALPAAVILITIEFVIGMNLLFKVYVKFTTILALLFMCVMTVLTLYTAIANPVSDCGCFGDALVISNQATFAKNVVLLAFAIYMVIRSEYIRPLFMPVAQAVIALAFILLGLGICIYCYTHLPLINFRPYKKGTNIPSAMIIPEGKPHNIYETTFIYEKEGVRQEFTLNNYPKNDSTWVFIDQKTTLISKGYEPPIHDFAIIDSDLGDITEDVISFPGTTYFVVMYDVNLSSTNGAQKAEHLYQQTKLTGDKFYALTGSSNKEIENFRQKTGMTFPFYETDPVTLKTMIRANPGFIQIKNGTITDKWNWRDINIDKLK